MIPSRHRIARFARHEGAATAIEYGLIAALIAVVIISGVSTLGKNIGKVFNTVASNITTASSS